MSSSSTLASRDRVLLVQTHSHTHHFRFPNTHTFLDSLSTSLAPLSAQYPCLDPRPPYLSYESRVHQMVQLGAGWKIHSSHKHSTLQVPSDTLHPLDLSPWTQELLLATSPDRGLLAKDLCTPSTNSLQSGEDRDTSAAACIRHTGGYLWYHSDCWHWAPHFPHASPSCSCLLRYIKIPPQWLGLRPPCSASWHWSKSDLLTSLVLIAGIYYCLWLFPFLVIPLCIEQALDEIPLKEQTLPPST